jgi:heme-degrading monooxygenase HmoA
MYAVAFEVLPSESGYQPYLNIAAALRPELERIDGFVSVERYKSLTHPGWILSLSLWRDEEALIRWRSHGEHHAAQSRGREEIFSDYRIRVLRIASEMDVPQHGNALVGFCEYPPKRLELQTGSLYESLMNPGKRIAMHDFADAEQARAWQAMATAPAHAFYGTVVRDYGLFERQQAPQVFPERTR